jgi:hypothetical protein
MVALVRCDSEARLPSCKYLSITETLGHARTYTGLRRTPKECTLKDLEDSKRLSIRGFNDFEPFTGTTPNRYGMVLLAIMEGQLRMRLFKFA